MELLQRIRTAYTDSGAEQTSVETASGRVLETMINAGRPSRKAGAGFYSYDEAGKRGKLWPGLWDTFGVAEQQPPFADLQDRFLFTEALETQRCFDEGADVDDRRQHRFDHGDRLPGLDRRHRAVRGQLPRWTRRVPGPCR